MSRVNAHTARTAVTRSGAIDNAPASNGFLAARGFAVSRHFGNVWSWAA